MRVRAPGKLLITGAYAVLEGAPAVVIAVNRYVYVQSHDDSVDTRELYDGQRKLGLGSSSATAVARLALSAASAGEDITSAEVRERIFRSARGAHAAEQSGGSGVDIAAATFGGALQYTMAHGARRARLPSGTVLRAFWSGTSARTSDLRANVSALRSRDGGRYEALMNQLGTNARDGADAVANDDVTALIAAASSMRRALARLGDAAGAAIVPSAFARLGDRALEEGAAFFPSGAGGGDVALFLGEKPPSATFLRACSDEGFSAVDLALDDVGVCVCSSA